MSMESPDELQRLGLLILGEGVIIEPNVDLCHPTRSGERKPVKIGAGCHIRSGTVIYSGVELGDSCQTGHKVMVREDVTVGHHSILGTGATCEFGTTIGHHVSIETHAYITALMVVEDYVFVAPGVVTTNDRLMLWQRKGAREHLIGPKLRWGCRVGAGTVIFPGAEVGRRAIVGAGSVVRRDIPERALAVGNPARIVRILEETEDPILEE
jgi:UDP-2-acetamido-3-amino-2,3-dideoxy-glucuronate N-acetyltransferase